MTADVDVIVLGLGGMGSAAVAHLAARGTQVLGLEQFTPAHALGSSHGETRIVRQAYFEHPDYVPLLRRSYELWHDLERDVGRPLLHLHGGLMLGAADSSVVAGTRRSAERWHLAHEVIDGEAMAIRYPQFGLRAGDLGVFETVAGFVSPEAAIVAQLDVARANGADLRFGVRVEGWGPTDGGVEVAVAGERITARRLVLSAGAWTNAMGADVGVPLRPVRRYVAWFEPTGDPELFRPDRFPVYVFETSPGDAIYGFPETTPGEGAKVGFHDRGGECDPDALDRDVTETEIDELREVLAERIPALAGGRCLASSVCMYTMTPDEHFVLGWLPGAEGSIAVAAGFSGHGFKFTPVVGEVLADLAISGTTDLPIHFLAPGRTGLVSGRSGRRRS